jgi:hypothetical protein
MGIILKKIFDSIKNLRLKLYDITKDIIRKKDVKIRLITTFLILSIFPLIGVAIFSYNYSSNTI